MGRLSVVMPVFNEVRAIREIIRRVLAQQLVGELIIVDDSSTDGTTTVLEHLAASDDRIVFIQHSTNRGKGAAIRTAIPHCRGDLVIVQDADLEYSPTDYGALVAPFDDPKVSAVYGSRFLEGKNRVGKVHRACNAMITVMTNLMTGYRLTDSATCYKVFRRALICSLALQENGFGFCPEVTSKLAGLSSVIVEVPVTYHARSRSEGKKLRLIAHGWEACICLVKYRG